MTQLSDPMMTNVEAVTQPTSQPTKSPTSKNQNNTPQQSTVGIGLELFHVFLYSLVPLLVCLLPLPAGNQNSHSPTAFEEKMQTFSHWVEINPLAKNSFVVCDLGYAY